MLVHRVRTLVTNNAATAKASPADAGGRVLEVSVWYPIDKKVAASGIPLVYDQSTSSMLNYGAGPLYLAHRPLLDVRVDPSSILPLTLSGPNVTECNNPLGTACSSSTIVGLPVSKKGPFPVLGFSHGGGVTQKVYSVLSEHMASHGDIVVAPRHSGNSFPDSFLFSGTGGLTCGALPIRPCSDIGAIPSLNRPQDISFALDKIFDGTFGADLKKAANINRVGIFGHSAGARATLLLTGGLQTETDGFAAGDLADPLIRAAVSISGGIAENIQTTPPLILPAANIEAIHIPMAVMVGERESNVLGFNLIAETEEIFNRLDTDKTGVKYRIVVDKAVHNSFFNFCEQGYLDGVKLGNANPGGIDSRLLAGLFLFNTRIPPYPPTLVGKTDGGYQALCRNSFLYEPTNRAIWDAISIAPGITLGGLLLNNPPFSIPLANLPGFIDPNTSQFVPTRTSDEVQKTTNGYLVAFFNTYLKKQSQYKRFLVSEEGEAEVKVCKQVGHHKEKCKIAKEGDDD